MHRLTHFSRQLCKVYNSPIPVFINGKSRLRKPSETCSKLYSHPGAVLGPASRSLRGPNPSSTACVLNWILQLSVWASLVQLHTWRVIGHRQEPLCILSVSLVPGAGVLQRVRRLHPEALELRADPIDRGPSFLPWPHLLGC